MKSFKAISLIIVVLLSVVACSTTRHSTVEKETLTQTYFSTADSGSHHATYTRNDSVREESWEEVEIEWESTPADTVQIDSTMTELQKMLYSIRSSGAVKAVIRKGNNKVNVSSIKNDSVSDHKTLSKKDIIVQSCEKSEVKKTKRPDWQFIVFYIVVMACLSLMVVVTRKLFKSI